MDRPCVVAALGAAMHVFTIIALQLIQSLPIIALGGGHGRGTQETSHEER
ncbi:hypothetical protein [Azospirillum tabaci]|nr:hypothetical protein [Azospirillum tabaci]